MPRTKKTPKVQPKKMVEIYPEEAAEPEPMVSEETTEPANVREVELTTTFGAVAGTVTRSVRLELDAGQGFGVLPFVFHLNEACEMSDFQRFACDLGRKVEKAGDIEAACRKAVGACCKVWVAFDPDFDESKEFKVVGVEVFE